MNAIINKKRCDYRLSTNIKHLAKSELDLLKAEDEVKKISLYLWLSYKLPDIFYDVENAYRCRILVNQYCEDSLKLNLKNTNEKIVSFKKDTFRRDKDKARDENKKDGRKRNSDKKDLKGKKFNDTGRAGQRPSGVKKHKIRKKEEYA